MTKRYDSGVIDMKSEATAETRRMTRGASLAAASDEAFWLRAISFISALRIPRSVLVPIGLAVLVVVVMTQRQFLLALVDHNIVEIKVFGELNHLSSKQIESRLETYLQTSFLTADLQQLKADVESLPWVYRSTVSRVWPGKISVSVEEQVAVAYWNAGAYLNALGDIFTPAKFVIAGEMPRLSGPESSEQHVRAEMLETLKDLQVLLQAYDLRAAQLQLKPRGVWDVTLDNGILIALGQLPFESKIERLGAVLSNASGDAIDRIEEVDARYPNGVAIKWKEIVVAAGIGS